MSETRDFLVFGAKTFRIKVPVDSKVTFAPFSPPSKHDGYARNSGGAVGTLRIYDGANEKKIIAVFSGVSGFRDMSLGYEEEVAVEEGARIWKSDDKGYSREENVKVQRKWVVPELEEGEAEEEESPS